MEMQLQKDLALGLRGSEKIIVDNSPLINNLWKRRSDAKTLRRFFAQKLASFRNNAYICTVK